eukprot:CAMPEP_0172917450 /NCGR_PEP_ID=MMETSP1075-20121228/198371_1 /TAXON_ID=2916 /ORGANISM="Ceratium fusus, Strain PA161109" /LENGTH=69 /DNA_ID=CAMNT_0013776929 /DNA_START=410 /DNA_END=615 /DNA_ORIENTATION=+
MKKYRCSATRPLWTTEQFAATAGCAGVGLHPRVKLGELPMQALLCAVQKNQVRSQQKLDWMPKRGTVQA